MLLCVSAVFKGVLSLLGVAPRLAPFLHRRPAASPMLAGGPGQSSGPWSPDVMALFVCYSQFFILFNGGHPDSDNYSQQQISLTRIVALESIFHFILVG